MNQFRIKEKAKAVAKIEILNSILDDVATLQLSKGHIIALIKGTKDGLQSVVKFYEDKEIEDNNAAVSN